MGVMTFNGVSNVDIGVEVELIPDYVIPEREYDILHVPGRSGDIVIDKGSFKNAPRTYQISALTPNGQLFSDLANDIAEWLSGASGYAVLEDSYEPEYYRYACFHETNTITSIFGKAGKAVINFDCKPQRYLKSGDTPVVFSGSGTINNPTGFVSLPILNISITPSASGTVSINNQSFSINTDTSGSYSVLTVNSEVQDVYSGLLNKNSRIVLNGGEFPTLQPGINNISFTGGITMVEVIPKWWTV